MVKLYFYGLLSLICCLTTTGLLAQGINSSNPQVPFGSTNSYQYGLMPANLPNGFYGKSTDAANAYLAWKKRYVASCSNNQFRVKFDEPENTVSEGIGYGMLLAAYAGDKALLDGLWGYYKTNSNNRIMNWKIGGCNSTIGGGGATDAELDAALALIVAENQWPLAVSPYNYIEEAKPFLQRIYEAEMDKGNGQANNGPNWPDGGCRNPSYQSPAYYKIFGDVNDANSNFWKTTAVNGAYTLIKANDQKFMNNGLLSDWSNSGGDPNQCQSNSSKHYGYEAARNPWRMATDVIWFNDATGASQANRVAAYVKSKGAAKITGPVSPSSPGSFHNATYVSTFAVGLMGAGSSYQSLLNEMYTETVYTEDGGNAYFGNTLRVISLFMMTGNFWKPAVSKAAEIHVVRNSANVPSGSTVNLGNVTQSTTRNFNFTIQNTGAAALSIGNMTFSGAAASKFSVTGTKPTSINAGSTAEITVAVAPGTQTGDLIAELSIVNGDANENPYVIRLNAVSTQDATTPEIDVKYKGTAVSSSLNLGSATANSNVTYPLTIANPGSAPLTIISIDLSGTNFALYGPAPKIIAAGDSAVFLIAVQTNTSAGNQTGSVTIKNDDSNESTYAINLTIGVANCSNPVTGSKILTDYEGNVNVQYEIKSNIPSLPKGGFNPALGNPGPSALNNSAVVAGYIRDTTDGQWDQLRYLPCGHNAFDVKTTPGMSLLVYSPRPGVPVKLSFKTAAGKEINADYSSDITKTTTTTNQWEKLYFPFTTLFKNTTDPQVGIIDIMVDADLSFMRTNKIPVFTIYFDELKYDTPPCPAGPTITYTGAAEICPGGTLALKANYSGTANTVYKWTKTGSGTSLGTTSGLNVTEAGSYTVAVTDGSCSGTATAVTVKYKLCAKTITGPEVVKSSQTGVEYSVPAAVEGHSYNWKLPAGAVITAANSDSSKITVTFGITSGEIVLTERNSSASMQNKLSVTVNVITETARTLFSNLIVSPNPGNGHFAVDMTSEYTGQIKFAVYNALGEMVFKNEAGKLTASEKYELHLESLPQGVYLLEIETAAGSVTERIIKQ